MNEHRSKSRLKNNAAQKFNRILLVDDDAIDSEFHKRLLSKMDIANEIINFTYSEDAIDFLIEKNDDKTDLILLDINIPRMTGFEFLDSVRSLKNIKKIPLIALVTTSESEHDKEQAKKYSEIVAMINKPLTMVHMKRLLAALNSDGS